ncbi:MAG: glycosyltransferase family 2 protein [Hyphomicrobiaceae bacterium]
MRRDLAIIMPTRNRPDIACNNLRKVHAMFPDVAIYICDDASENGALLVDRIKDIPNCILIRNEKAIGPAGARRRLIEEANACWCLALDDDCYPRDDFDPSRWINSEPGKNDPIIVSFRCIRSYDNEIAPGGDLQPGPTRSLMGGASILHRKSIIDLGNYKQAYVFGAEDTDLARRVWAAGRQLWIDPDNVIVHDHVAAGRDLPREAYYYVRNRVLLNALTLPLWFGVPLGLAQATKCLLTHPHRAHATAGLISGVWSIFANLDARQPLSLAEYRALQNLPS